MQSYRFVRFLGQEVEAVGDEIEEIAQEIVEEYEQGELPSEREVNPVIADRIKKQLLRRLGERLDGWEKDGIEFFARVLSSQKEGSEESVTGADLAIVFETDLPDYQVSKSVLVQSKTLRSRSVSNQFNTQELGGEVDRMLDCSSDSFVFVFPVNGSIKVIPAFAIKAITNAGEPIPSRFPEELYTKSIGRFFEELAECYIGDHRIVPLSREPLGWEKEPYQERADQLNLDMLYLAVSQTDDAEAF